jgi:hypothetical protein
VRRIFRPRLARATSALLSYSVAAAALTPFQAASGPALDDSLALIAIIPPSRCWHG